MVEALGRGEVHVWRAGLDVGSEVVNRLADLLSADERERAARMQLPSVRRQFIVARGRLRELLGRYTEAAPARVRFEYDALGKPHMVSDGVEQSIEFSVSHSKGQALLGFARDLRIGVDLERVRETTDVDAITRRFFAAGERAALAALPESARREAFFACWTRKEALLKAVGLGISQGLDRVEVSCVPDVPARLCRSDLDEIDIAEWSLHDIDVEPGFKAALAANDSAPRVVCRDLPAD